MPTRKINPKEIHVNELIDKANKTYERDVYANHVQVALTQNELFVDFYYVTPLGNKPELQHVQRMVLPVSLAKGMASAIANVVALFEEDHNQTLANSREPDPEDKINIWP